MVTTLSGKRTHDCAVEGKEDVLVTPSPNGPKKGRVGLFHDHEKHDDNKTIDAKRNLFGTTEPHLSITKGSSPMGENTTEQGTKTPTFYGILKDIYDQSYTFPITKEATGIKSCKRSKDSNLTLYFDESSNAVTLFAVARCWISSPNNREWERVPLGNPVQLSSGSHTIRLVKPRTDSSARKPRQEFQLQIHGPPSPGTYSFDWQYLELVKEIMEDGREQKNAKGPNLTLRKSFGLEIDLSDEKGRYLLPITSLRNLFRAKSAIVESLWYVRGENHVEFLHQNGCKFWDQQCGEGGFVGLSYGLLTNHPQSNGKPSCNPLEENVLKPLCKLGSQSRKMVCSLVKDDEKTVQKSCTLGIQFTVCKKDNNEYLDLTVSQRSSDIVLGLPNDVVAWSVILHLVCRDVYIRTDGRRNLAAGTLNFIIAGGGAHIYFKNMENARQILERKPIEECQPRLNILGHERNEDILLSGDEKPIDMFQVARKTYPGSLKLENDVFSVKGYEPKHAAIKIEQAG